MNTCPLCHAPLQPGEREESGFHVRRFTAEPCPRRLASTKQEVATSRRAVASRTARTHDYLEDPDE